MGNPAIYWYPDPVGSLEILDFGEPLSDLQITSIRDGADAWTRSSNFYRTTGASRLQIQVILENFTSASLWRKLDSLQTHLERGGSIGFTLDTAKAWASFVRPGAYAQRGKTTLLTSGNLFSAWSSSASIASGGTIVINSSAPESLREYRTLSSTLGASDKAVSLSGGLTYTFSSEPVLVRERDFYPAMVMPEAQLGTPIVTSNHRISHTLDLTLEEDWGTLAAIAENVTLRDDTESGISSKAQSVREVIEDRQRRMQMNAEWGSNFKPRTNVAPF